MNIGIYIYPQAEVLDFSGPFEVFSTASRICTTAEPFKTFLISENLAPVTARGGLNVLPHFSIENHPTLDVLIISGGVYTEEINKLQVLQWIELQSSMTQITASVCTGAFLLAAACPNLTGQVTTHWEDAEDLQLKFKHFEVMRDVRWIEQGKFITSGGISAGIDMCLHLVERLYSTGLANKTARQMEYNWHTNCNE